MLLSIDVGIKNLAICAISPDAQITHWELLQCDPTALGVKKSLSSLPYLEDVTRVVIERQPTKNQTMKCMEAYIHMYFVMMGHCVTLISPKQKLVYAKASPYWPCLDLPNTYYNRKKISVETVKNVVTQTNQPLAPVFLNSKKKDDLADAALQGLAFIASKGGVPLQELPEVGVCVTRNDDRDSQ